MTLLMAVEGAEELKQGIWRLSLPPHQALMFGDCRNHQGQRSVLLVSDPKYDAHRSVLQFRIEGVVPLNIGSTSEAIAIADETKEAAVKGAPAKSPDGYGPGDRDFLRELTLLPREAQEAGKQLLERVRERSPGDLKRGLKRNFSNTPDNFWYVIVQPNAGALSITVRGQPSQFQSSSLDVKDDRPGYSRFKLSKRSEVEEALRIISQSRRKRI